MITQTFPTEFQRYLSLPLLGPWMDAYAAWLQSRQYTWRSSRYEMRMAARVCEFLKHRGIHKIEDLGEHELQTCEQRFRQQFPKEAGSVRVLASFLSENGLIQSAVSTSEPAPMAQITTSFTAFLREMRGYAPRTIQRHDEIVTEFLGWLKFEHDPQCLSGLKSEQLEGFLAHLAKRMGRAALQKAAGIMRNFLRFLSLRGVVTPELSTQIDRPRIYRQEQLPRAVPWPTVQALLRAIDRRGAIGKRDYAILTLITSYGLRAGDIAALTLDDLHWRAGRLRVVQPKTGKPLELPLTHPVIEALYDYLKNVPRHLNSRQLFVRLKAPSGALKATGVTEAFQRWVKKSGLPIPFHGPHCLRHSYALNLLRRGLPIKMIGDLLGHRSPESTCVYLRLSTEDLRGVALHVPTMAALPKGGQP